ncbi:MAG: hypothetical protein AAGF23_27315 [Acidobacteriota bacterium]
MSPWSRTTSSPYPPFFTACLALVAMLILTGCVKKSDFEALQAELDACEAAKAESQAAVLQWEQRYDRESARWTQIEESVSSAVPNALSELHQERERILELVPDQVQNEVSGFLDEYFNTVMAGFDRMARDNQDLKVEVLGLTKAMEVLGTDTKQIGRAIDESLADEKSRRERLARDLADVIDLVVEFDQTRVNCDKCPDRLRMRDKYKEQLLGFHQELIADLAGLQTYAAGIPGQGDAEAAAADTPAADGAGTESADSADGDGSS